MSEEDDADYRRSISRVLRAHGFGWVVDQVESQIAAGKSIDRQVSDRESTLPLPGEDFNIQRPRSRRPSLITSEPYTESEKLEILLQGIEAALVQRSMIEQAVLEEMEEFSIISFEPDVPLEEGDELRARGRGGHALEPGRRATARAIEAEARSALDGMRGRTRVGS